jgi:putative flippase GtrA
MSRFVIVSGLNTFFGFSVYALLVFSGLTYPLALLLSTVCGVCFNFTTIGRLVFNNTKGNLFFRFTIVYVLLYFVNLLFIKEAQVILPNLYFASFVAMIPGVLLAFILNKSFVFRGDHKTNQAVANQRRASVVRYEE